MQSRIGVWRRMVLLAVWGVVLFSGSLWAAETGKIDYDKLEWGEEAGGFRVAVIVPAEAVEVGKPVEVTVLVRNVSQQKLFLHESDPDRDVIVKGTDPEGKGVVLTDWGRKFLDAGVRRRNFASKHEPGEVFKVKLQIEKMYELKKLGTYTLQFNYPVDRHVGGELRTLPIWSPPVIVKIKGAV